METFLANTCDMRGQSSQRVIKCLESDREVLAAGMVSPLKPLMSFHVLPCTDLRIFCHYVVSSDQIASCLSDSL